MKQLEFNLKELMENFTASMEYSAKEKGLDFTCTMEPDLPEYFTGDPERIRQILTNLTGNALKFTERGKISVTCRLEKKLPDSHLVYFSVKDTGIGIPKDIHVKLFQKFTQADSSTTRKDGETGHGLAISKQLTELMGGDADIAENGEKAVKALKNTSYDLVFMDMQMPVMSSNEAARIIRDRNSDVLNHDIPIIAMTANVMKDDRDIYLEGRRG